jgi:hypothetical protein
MRANRAISPIAAGTPVQTIATYRLYSTSLASVLNPEDGCMDSDLDLFGTLIDRAGFRARLVHEHSIFIESLIIYELLARQRPPFTVARNTFGSNGTFFSSFAMTVALWAINLV